MEYNEDAVEKPYPQWFSLFHWCIRHNVSGTELMHLPLLLWYAVFMLMSPYDPHNNSVTYRELQQIAPIDWWSIAPGCVVFILIFAILTSKYRMHQWSLGLVAGWWILIASFLIHGGVYLTSAAYIIMAATALWRVGELVVRERV